MLKAEVQTEQTGAADSTGIEIINEPVDGVLTTELFGWGR
jgi:hypothetical protein